jgi:hypothetical protein
MNLSLSVLLTLLFLAPGFAGYFGFTLAAGGRSVRRAPPAPNSLTFLVIISFIALAAHSGALILFTVQDAFCRNHACVALGFEPDAYARLATLLRSGGTDIRSSILVYEMGWLVALCAATFQVARMLTIRDLRRGERSHVAGQLYRWLALYARDVRSGDAAVTAYVLTKLRHEDLAIGYRGVVSEVSLTSEGEVSSITLAAVDRFGLRLNAGEPGGQRTLQMSGLLSLVHIPGAEIENIVLAVTPFDDWDDLEIDD